MSKPRKLAQAWRGLNPRREVRRRLARWYAARYGYRGVSGGWIYICDGRGMRPVAQGWDAFYERLRPQILAELAREEAGQ